MVLAVRYRPVRQMPQNAGGVIRGRRDPGANRRPAQIDAGQRLKHGAQPVCAVLDAGGNLSLAERIGPIRMVLFVMMCFCRGVFQEISDRKRTS